MTTVHTTRSSMLREISYDEAEQKLTVVFSNGGTYEYAAVPRKIFDEMLNAESEGEYFLANVKGKYECKKI